MRPLSPIADIQAVPHAARMRTALLSAFTMTFAGPEGPYTIRFRPTDKRDGIIDVSIGGLEMRWDVVDADQEEGGGIVLGGITTGSDKLWNDQFWFELRLSDTSRVIRYWGDQSIWREDSGS